MTAFKRQELLLADRKIHGHNVYHIFTLSPASVMLHHLNVLQAAPSFLRVSWSRQRCIVFSEWLNAMMPHVHRMTRRPLPALELLTNADSTVAKSRHIM
jgi:hypothetical protein